MYFHGRPCKQGHTLRRTSDRHCVECNAKRNRDWQSANPSAANLKNREWRKNNPEKSRAQGRKRYARKKAADPRKYMLTCARRRARVRGLECTIAVTDIIIPTHCPLLGTLLVVNEGAHGPNSPSLDRVFNSYGYVPGNVVVVSHQANARKGELSSPDLRTLTRNLARLERDAMHAMIKK